MSTEKTPINFIEISTKLWKHRKLYYFVLPTILIITFLITICIPRYYKCTVSLAPETGVSSMSGSITSLASSFGLGSSLAKINSQDALYAEIYPELMKSNNFVVNLMNVDVKTKDGLIKTKYYTYMRDHQKQPWWDIIKGKIYKLFKTPEPTDNYTGKEQISIFNLTKKQSDIFESVKKHIKGDYDKKTEIVSITVTDQDPLVCATIADITCKKLQEFIIDYRTNKARIDEAYYKELAAEARKQYDKARQDYATFADTHQDLLMTSYKTKMDDLENEMQIKHNIYTMVSNQLQMATAKLQESTPAFTMIQTASMPVKPAGPKRVFISIAMMILSSVILTGWLILKEYK